MVLTANYRFITTPPEPTGDVGKDDEGRTAKEEKEVTIIGADETEAASI